MSSGPPAGRCSSTPPSSTCTAARSRSDPGTSRWRCGWPSARRTGRSPTRTWLSAVRRSPRRSNGSWEGGSVPASVSVFGAAGFAGALCARLVHRHPSFELRAVTSRSDVGVPLDQLYPHHRVPLVLEELDLDRHAGVDAAIVAYPHGASAPVVSALRERGVRVVDLSADFRLRDPTVYERWYRSHEAPELIADAVYGLPELYRDQIRDADL